MSKRNFVILGTIIFVSLLLAFVFYDNYTKSNVITVDIILNTNQTIIGQLLEYPQGTPNIITSIVTIPIGVEKGFHTHENILAVYVMQGELTINYEDHATKKYSKGDSFVEAINISHKAKNTGITDTKLIVVTLK